MAYFWNSPFPPLFPMCLSERKKNNNLRHFNRKYITILSHLDAVCSVRCLAAYDYILNLWRTPHKPALWFIWGFLLIRSFNFYLELCAKCEQGFQGSNNNIFPLLCLFQLNKIVSKEKSVKLWPLYCDLLLRISTR